MKNWITLSMVIVSLLVMIFACNQKNESSGHLGEISFSVTGTPAAQASFQEGLLLLHSFEFADARKAFEKAQAIDSTCLMAFWGEAMSYNHPLWRQQNYDLSIVTLERGEEILKIKGEDYFTEREQDFWKAIRILYLGEGTKFERDKSYADFMGKMMDENPGDHEVAAFYSLALLGSVPVGRDDEIFEKSAEIAKSIIEENPNHPGALHYLIHSYDDPYHAELAVDAAHRYAKVAPDAAHALHMPSHIYVALGMWDYVVQSNIDSYGASVQRMERNGLDHSARSYHAFHWLLYGYLQQRNEDEANRIMEEMHKYTREVPSKSARDYLISMVGNYMIETQNYNSEWIRLSVKDTDLNIVSRVAKKFIKGWIFSQNNQIDSLASIIEHLKFEIEQASYRVTDAGVPMCKQGQNPLNPNRLDISQSEIMLLELRARKAILDNNIQQADSLLTRAVKLEGEASYTYGPPVIMLPSFEMYGNFLLEQGRYDDAVVQFELALKRGPGRTLALEGCEKAYRLAGYKMKAKQMTELISKNMTSDLPKIL